MRRIVMAAILAAGFAASSPVAIAAAQDAAVIVDSGSTNAAGFRIVVERSGNAVYTPTARRSGRQADAAAKSQSRKVPSALVRSFYADLDGEKPLAALPSHGCMKSASFGTTLTIEHGGDKSPDLSCGDHGDARLKALIAHTNEIVKLFESAAGR